MAWYVHLKDGRWVHELREPLGKQSWAARMALLAVGLIIVLPLLALLALAAVVGIVVFVVFSVIALLGQVVRDLFTSLGAPTGPDSGPADDGRRNVRVIHRPGEDWS